MRTWLVAAVLLAGCKGGERTTDTRSSSFKSQELKLTFLHDYLAGPTTPLDAEFHIVYRDNSAAFIPTKSELDFQAVIRVKPDQVPKWSENCVRYRLEANPVWAQELVAGKKGWERTGQPDTFRCGLEQRVIHVKEGVIIWRLTGER